MRKLRERKREREGIISRRPRNSVATVWESLSIQFISDREIYMYSMSITGRLIERQNGLTAINIVNVTRLWNERY